ncbi:N-succinyldiaminopimelate aminotransferase [Marchantia polymorpha subsp. ruderalis]
MMLASSCSLQWPSSLDPAKVVVIGEQARDNLAFPRGIVARRLLSALWPSLPCSRSPVAGWGIRRQPLTVMASSVVDDGGGLSADSVPKAHAPQISRRLANLKPTVFTKFSVLALEHNAINLGQGFPNFDGPEYIKEAAIEAINTVGKNQYARGHGIPALNAAIAERFNKETGLTVDPEAEVTVTSGCSEAIAATMIGLINSGDEVILFSPFYDSYEATLAMVDAKIKSVTLRPPDFAVPVEELKSAFSSNTRAILVNTPHNPTGKIFSRTELELIASLCKEHDALAISDEVYDKLVFEGEHISIASLEGMFERTITLNSLGKTFSLTGWKIGWAIAPPHLTWGIRQAHSYITFAVATPLQWATVAALKSPDSYYEELVEEYSARKEILIEGLKDVGFEVYEPKGTYFVMADHTPFGFKDDTEFCEYLVKEVGVAAIPPSCFYSNPDDGKHLVRFAFCKDVETIKEAMGRLKAKLKRPALISS